MMNKRLAIIFLLGFSSGLPFALITSTLQAWFADSGMPIIATGMLSLLNLPYLCRPLIGPVLDRYTLNRLGRRRSWMLVTQLSLLIGFNIMTWSTPTGSPLLLAFTALIIAVFSATQDSVIDAQRIEYLPILEHGMGASISVLGYRLALFITGGMALVVAHTWGWVVMYRLMGFLMLVGIGATWLSAEPNTHKPSNISLKASFTAPIYDLVRRPGMLSLISFIIFYKVGEAFTTTTSGIVMPFLIQGLGFSLDTIGYINKILGIGAILIGGLVAGIILARCSLYRALLIFGLLQALTNSLFVVLAVVEKNIILLALAVGCDNFAAGMATTALVVLFMRLVNRQYTATQMSFFVAIAMIPRMLSGPIAAFLQMALGWLGLYQIALVLSFGFIPFLLIIRKQLEQESETLSDNIASGYAT